MPHTVSQALVLINLSPWAKAMLFENCTQKLETT